MIVHLLCLPQTIWKLVFKIGNRAVDPHSFYAESDPGPGPGQA